MRQKDTRLTGNTHFRLLFHATRSVTASQVRARGSEVCVVCVRAPVACHTAGPYQGCTSNDVNSRSDSDEGAIANVYATPSPARATDRPNERPTDQPDRTRERRLRLHSLQLLVYSKLQAPYHRRSGGELRFARARQ